MHLSFNTFQSLSLRPFKQMFCIILENVGQFSMEQWMPFNSTTWVNIWHLFPMMCYYFQFHMQFFLPLVVTDKSLQSTQLVAFQIKNPCILWVVASFDSKFLNLCDDMQIMFCLWCTFVFDKFQHVIMFCHLSFQMKFMCCCVVTHFHSGCSSECSFPHCFFCECASCVVVTEGTTMSYCCVNELY